MEIETFEVAELNPDTLEFEDMDKAIELINDLGLEGQKKLINKDDEGVTLCPYRQMTAEEQFGYTRFLTTHDKVEEYSAGPIPIRVLQVLSHAKTLGIFSHFSIWHSIGDPDPVLLAKPSGETEWNSVWYILARWGSELAPFKELKEKAAIMHLAEVKNELVLIRSKVEDKLASLENFNLSGIEALRTPFLHI